MQYCWYNATFAPPDECTSMAVGSFSVDCLEINGTLKCYTTVSVAPQTIAAPSGSLFTSVRFNSSATDGSGQTTKPVADTSTTSIMTASGDTHMKGVSTNSIETSSTSQNLAASSTHLGFLLSTTAVPPSSFYTSTLPPSSSTPSPGGQARDESGGISKKVQIVLGSVIPGVFVIATVLALLWWKPSISAFIKKHRISEEKVSASAGTELGEIRAGGSDTQKSDVRSQFSLPDHAQADLVDGP